MPLFSYSIGTLINFVLLYHFRYVNSQGKVVGRFLALIHVTETTSDALKEALFGVLDRHKLSVSRIRGQGYDGASI